MIWEKYAERAVDATDKATLKALGYMVNTPLRFMAAGDVWLRSAYYQEKLAVKLHREAKDRGFKMRSEEYAKYIKARMDNPTKEDRAEAREAAAEGVFMNKAGKVLEAFKSLRNWASVPGWLVVPFIHTNAKALKWSTQRIPVLGAGIGAKGTDPADLIARQLAGASIAALALMVLDDDDDERITGAYPENQADREQWRDFGYKALECRSYR